MKQAFIVATGPSLNKEGYDFDYLNRFDLFALNRGYLHDKIRPKYLVVVNDLVLKQFGKEIVDYCNRNNVTLFAPAYLLKSFPKKFHNLNFRGDVPYFETKFGAPVWQGHTVTYVAMQLAYQLGYQKVGVIGLDHYYKRAEGKPTNKEELAQGDDPDHFHPGYFKDVKWHTPNLWKSELAYRLARVYYEHDRRILVNCTHSSKLHWCVLKKVDYRVLESLTFENYLRI